MSTIEHLAAAEDWYNSRSKFAVISWATENRLDIGQHREQLDDDWNEKVIGAYAKQLAPARG
jgi:hypothetical protein